VSESHVENCRVQVTIFKINYEDMGIEAGRPAPIIHVTLLYFTFVQLKLSFVRLIVIRTSSLRHGVETGRATYAVMRTNSNFSATVTLRLINKNYCTLCSFIIIVKAIARRQQKSIDVMR
jgi:hypothetical protein